MERLKQNLRKGWLNSVTEIKSNPIVYLLLTIILLLALFVRVYRLDQLLGFYFDQGRDALVIWRLWHEGKLFLIGPVTGLAGIFLGPFYYYLIAPSYLIGGGNPVYPAVFLAFLSVIAIGIIYYLGWKMQSRITGLIAAVVCSFSYYLVLAGRWLSNPTPILLASVVLLLGMWKIANKGSDNWWLVIASTIGISLHFESASAVFYIPMVLVFYLWFVLESKLKVTGVKLNHPAGVLRSHPFITKKILILTCLVFLLTLLPQIVFNFKHENILINNFQRVFLEEKSFRSPFGDNLKIKKDLFWGIFTSKIFPGQTGTSLIFYMASLTGLLLILRKNPKVILLFAIFLGVPALGYIFYQGNNGNLYDYYLTGYYFPIMLFFSLGLGALWNNVLGKLILLWFVIIFLNINGILVWNNIRAGVDGETHVSLGNQVQAVDWVFDNAKAYTQFNVDSYVPPVIPYTYDYLFLWQGTRRCGVNLCGLLKDVNVGTLYTLYEQDPPHPERLEVWLDRQKGIASVEEEKSFGGITVQRRKRI